MARRRITIDTVSGGISQSQYFAGKGQYGAGLAIDPDMPIDETSVRSSGFLRPTSMAKFSGTEVTGVPLWFVTNPKSTNTYLYANDGKVHTIDSSLAMGTALNSGNALTTASGNGAEYYDNYAYFATNTNITRYGPLNGSPALDQVYWGTTLSMTALTNTTYPSLRGVVMPNHSLLRSAIKSVVYVADVLASNVGALHQFSTKKTTVEGDTTGTLLPPTSGIITFDYGLYPSCLENYGDEIAIGLFEGTNTTIKQKPARIAFWDQESTVVTRYVELPDPLITAMKMVNGVLYVFSGNASGGCRVVKFSGGYTFTEVYYDEDGVPPLAGAVDSLLYKVLWGGSTTDPSTAAVVKSLGSKRAGFMNANAMHVPYKASSAGTTPTVTALKFIEHASFLKPQPVIGWTDGSGKGLDKASTTYGTATFQSEVFRVGVPFQVVSLTIPLAQVTAANQTITPTLYFDDASSNDALTVINSTNYPSTRHVKLEPTGSGGQNNFFLELAWSGSVLATVALPIIIDIETLEDSTG